jgi:hypothetical protein
MLPSLIQLANIQIHLYPIHPALVCHAPTAQAERDGSGTGKTTDGGKALRDAIGAQQQEILANMRTVPKIAAPSLDGPKIGQPTEPTKINRAHGGPRRNKSRPKKPKLTSQNVPLGGHTKPATGYAINPDLNKNSPDITSNERNKEGSETEMDAQALAYFRTWTPGQPLDIDKFGPFCKACALTFNEKDGCSMIDQAKDPKNTDAVPEGCGVCAPAAMAYCKFTENTRQEAVVDPSQIVGGSSSLGTPKEQQAAAEAKQMRSKDDATEEKRLESAECMDADSHMWMDCNDEGAVPAPPPPMTSKEKADAEQEEEHAHREFIRSQMAKERRYVDQTNQLGKIEAVPAMSKEDLAKFNADFAAAKAGEVDPIVAIAKAAAAQNAEKDKIQREQREALLQAEQKRREIMKLDEKEQQKAMYEQAEAGALMLDQLIKAAGAATTRVEVQDIMRRIDVEKAKLEDQQAKPAKLEEGATATAPPSGSAEATNSTAATQQPAFEKGDLSEKDVQRRNKMLMDGMKPVGRPVAAKAANHIQEVLEEVVADAFNLSSWGETCEKCALGFEANGGCDMLSSGGNPGSAVPDGCGDCAPAAMAYCKSGGKAAPIPDDEVITPPTVDPTTAQISSVDVAMAEILEDEAELARMEAELEKLEGATGQVKHRPKPQPNDPPTKGRSDAEMMAALAADQRLRSGAVLKGGVLWKPLSSLIQSWIKRDTRMLHKNHPRFKIGITLAIEPGETSVFVNGAKQAAFFLFETLAPRHDVWLINLDPRGSVR